MDNRVKRNNEFIGKEIRDTISKRYKRVTKAINQKFWNSDSETANSFYVGSYGRGTAINTSDIDILVELPKDEYDRYDEYEGNGQSRLLQSVKQAILLVYPTSDIRADGQIIKINFSDGILFEILPAFKNTDDFGNITYNYPDTNMGGNWYSTNPKAEIEELNKKDTNSNKLCKDTCKHIRRVKEDNFSSYKLSGIVIDTFVYHAMGNWKWTNSGEGGHATPGSYEKSLLDYFNINKYFKAAGSGESVNFKDSVACLEKVLSRMNS
jgi:predicted nucleotidyltransferase